jgi:O-antigen ligase
MPLAFALLLPLVFIHVEYQPTWTVAVGSTEATLALSDVAVLAIGAIGLVSGLRNGFSRLRAGRAIWVSSAAFLGVVFLSNVYGAIAAEEYAFFTHFLTAAKLTEYGLLALAAPLVLRSSGDLLWPLATLTIWSCAATVGAVLQFLGLINEFEGRRPGQREPSFLGIHDLAALSGATLALGLLSLALDERRRPGLVAGAAGGLGLVLAGATAAVAGIVAAGASAWALGRRRGLAIAAVITVVSAGVIAIRTVDTRPLLDALGVEHTRHVSEDPEASWSQRLALAYIGGRIFLAHPVFGVGWQASADEPAYGRFVGDARRRFPNLPVVALPSPQHPWGIQNAYVQAAADMGVVGLAAFLAFLVVPLVVAWRAGRRAAVPILWLLVSMGIWLGLGLVAGTPLVGLTWLAIGLAATAAAWREPV